MKLLVAGSRGISEFDLSQHIPDGIDLIISGGAGGIDEIAEKYADEHRISKLILRPNYKLYRKAAPLKRNELMVSICDEVLLVWDGASRGTAYTAKVAQKMGKIVKIVRVDKK